LSQHQFFAAHIAEVAMPTLDAASNDLVYMTLRIRPEGVRLLAGDNKKLEVEAPTPEKEWKASNFKVEIGDLPCDNVIEVELPKFTVKIIGSHIGSTGTKKVEVSNVKLTMPMSHVQPWFDWSNEVFTLGEQGQHEELDGSISIMNKDLTEELGRFELFQCAPVAFRPLGAYANVEDPASFEIELYVNRMAFKQ
jgi:hypothetical protein